MVRKPARWAKTGFKPFFAKMIEIVVLLVVPNPLLICFPTQWDRHTEYNSPCTCVAHKPGAINKNTFKTMCFPTWLQWCFCCLYRLCCLYVFSKWNRNIKWNSLCACPEVAWTHKPVQKAKKLFKQCFGQNDCTGVFAVCTESVVYMFFFQSNGTEMDSKTIYAHVV